MQENFELVVERLHFIIARDALIILKCCLGGHELKCFTHLNLP